MRLFRNVITLTLLLTLSSCSSDHGLLDPSPVIVEAAPTEQLQQKQKQKQKQTRTEEPAVVTDRLARPTRPTAKPPVGPPSVVASRVIVVDALTGRTIYSKNANQRCAVASTQKILTALTVMNAGSLSDQVRVQSSDTKVEPSKLYIKPGEIYTRRDLVKALMVKSGNDVAKALARDVGGTESAFMKRMNAHGRSLGMTNSNFLNPHGLTETGQYSTASDISKAALVAYRQPLLRSFMSTTNYTFQHPKGISKKLKNTNRLLRNNAWVTGMKTGTTRASGRCLVASGQHNGAHVIAVVLGSDSQNIWNDSEKILEWALQRP